MENLFSSWIQLATRAPSGDNSQPWDFTFAPGSFKVTINATRARHFLDQDSSATWISLGCLCENLKRSAPFFGFECDVILEADQSVTVKYHTTPINSDSKIIGVIARRQTFRGKMKNVILDLEDYNFSFPKVNLGGPRFDWLQVSRISRKLLWKWSWLESVLWLKTSLMRDFTKWLHPSNKNFEYGISLQNLQISLMDQLSLMLFKKIPALIKTVPGWFFRFKTYSRLKFLIENSSGLLCLTGTFSGPKDYFYAGMEIQRMWLYLTQFNIKAQPLAIQSLFLNFINTESVKNELSKELIEELRSIKAKTQSDLNMSQELLFILRYGVSKESLPLLPRKKILIPN